MPPKNTGEKKALEKKKVKVADDKTFGLKNKNKSKKVQKFIQTVSAAPKKVEGPSKKELKEEEQRRQDEIDALFKPAVSAAAKQVVAAGVDPKSVVCEFFVKGSCKKGAKCKFSHDLDKVRKAEKIDIYTDRTEPSLTGADGEYDEEELMKAIARKQRPNQTDIVCKFFIEAIEKTQYGWFWECPNGPTCHYRHALPPGFVLKSQLKKDAKDEEALKVSLEEELDALRAKIITGTPVTPDTFAEWKRKKLEEKKRTDEESRATRERDARAGRTNHLSGRELFTFNPDLFADDDEAMGDADLVVDEEGREDLYDITNLGKLAGVHDQVDGSDSDSDAAGAADSNESGSDDDDEEGSGDDDSEGDAAAA